MKVLAQRKTSIYLPSINSGIEQYIKACSTFQKHQLQEPRQVQEPIPPPEQT